MKELKTAGVRLPDSPLVPYPSRSLVPERDVRYTPVLEASRLGIDFGGLTPWMTSLSPSAARRSPD